MTGKINVILICLYIKADYVFLSPPWGGLKYKDSEYYSIREMMTPNIVSILKVCFSIAKKVVFYFPRTTLLEELFDVISEVYESTEEGCYFGDVHILNSANKVKAVMLIFEKDSFNVIL